MITLKPYLNQQDKLKKLKVIFTNKGQNQTSMHLTAHQALKSQVTQISSNNNLKVNSIPTTANLTISLFMTFNVNYPKDLRTIVTSYLPLLQPKSLESDFKIQRKKKTKYTTVFHFIYDHKAWNLI